MFPFRRNLILLALCGTMLVSCKVFRREDPGEAIAVVGTARLMPSDVEVITRGATSPEDSLARAEAYIKEWVEEALFSQKAMSSVDPELEEMVAAYRRQLYVGQYEEHLVNQKMNKSLLQDSIDAFYQQYHGLFVLEQPVVRGLMLVVPNGTPNMDKAQRWLQKPEAEIEKIEKFAYQYATGYELFLDRWLTANQLRQQLPLGADELATRLLREKQIVLQDSLQTYILQVEEKRLRGEDMPEVMAEPEIRRLLLQERQLLFIQEQKEKLYNEWKN